MDRELIIRLAREVGLWEMLEGYSSEYGSLDAEEDCLPELQRFAALVAAHEREACAKVCEEWFTPNLGSEATAAIAAAIRRRT